MNENLYEALEDCLIALETGADIESALKRFPEMADELRPLLEASVRARSLASTTVPSEAMRRGRAQLLQHAAGMRESKNKARLPVFFFRRFATALALALVVFLSGTGLVSASNGALPGDSLYPVKRTWEDVRLAFVVDPESREELETEFEQERLEEVDELLNEGRHETIAFAGIVTQMDGNQWMVSGIPVQIVETSQLPTEPIDVGSFVTVEGLTNLQGFVEANRIEILDFIGFLTPSAPVEIEGTLEAERNDGSESETGETKLFSGKKLDTENDSDEDDESGDRESIESQSLEKSDDKDNRDSSKRDEKDESSDSSDNDDGEEPDD